MPGEPLDLRRAFEVLADASRAFAEAGFDLERVFSALTKRVVQNLGDSAQVRLLTPDGAAVVDHAPAHRDPRALSVLVDLARQPMPADEGVTGVVLRTGRSLLLSTTPEELASALRSEHRRFAETFPVHAVVAAPLAARGETFGVVVVYRHGEGRPFTTLDQTLLQELAERAALAISSAREHQRALDDCRRLEALVTEERERASRAASRDLELLADALPFLVSRISADGRFLFVNRAYEERFARPRTEIVGRAVKELLADEEWATLEPHVSAVLAGNDVEFETPFRPAGAGDRQARGVYVPERGVSGRVESFVAIVFDVTEERRAESRLRFLAEATKVLASSLDVARTIDDLTARAVPRIADRCTVELDPARAPAATEVQVLGASDGAPTTSPSASSSTSTLRAPIATWRGAAGVLTLASLSAGRTFGAADVALAEELASRVALALENATLYEEARDAITKRDEFLSVASHELKTPLTSLELVLSSLRHAAERGRLGAAGDDSGASAKVLDRLQKAERQVRRLGSLVNELLDVSRISAGKLALDPQPMDFAPVVVEVTARFQEQAQSRGFSIALEVPPKAEGVWDKNRLDQVVTNLLSNAIKYGEGKPVEVRLESGGDAAECVRLTVVDHGVGIAEQDQARIFERFERAASERHYAGLGLGLWIANEIVEAHAGTLSVTSAVGQGSTFVVELPTRPPAQQS